VYGISGPAFAVVGILVLAADLGLKETFGKFLPEVGSPAPARYIFRRFVFVCLGLIGLFLLILDRMRPHVYGAKLLGAGGGGFLLMVCKSPEDGASVREMLEAEPPNDRARFFDFDISREGLVVTVCQVRRPLFRVQMCFGGSSRCLALSGKCVPTGLAGFKACVAGTPRYDCPPRVKARLRGCAAGTETCRARSGERAWNAPAHPVALAGEERRFSQPSASPDLTQAVL